jgi:hypothetical protein
LSRDYICGDGNEVSPLDGAELNSSSGVVTRSVFGILGSELLTASHALEQMLDNSILRKDVLAALSRIGHEASGFIPRIIADLDRQAAVESPNYYDFDAALALAAVSRGNAEVVEQLIARLSHDSPNVRAAAASVFVELGVDVCGQQRRIVELLRPMLPVDGEGYAAFFALASVGRHLPEVRKYIVERAAPRPPDWKTYPDMPEHRYDAVMWQRGTAIAAMKYLVDYPAECIDVLIEAIDTFEEYDPDESYGGPMARIAHALAQFGLAAAPAAEPLARHLNDDPDTTPTAILEALAVITVGSSEVVSLLESYCKAHGNEAIVSDAKPVKKEDDLVRWVIQRIRGQAE